MTIYKSNVNVSLKTNEQKSPMSPVAMSAAPNNSTSAANNRVTVRSGGRWGDSPTTPTTPTIPTTNSSSGSNHIQSSTTSQQQQQNSSANILGT